MTYDQWKTESGYRERDFDKRDCPKCGAVARADFVDIGVGMQQCGPFGCESCGWVEETSELDALLPDDLSDGLPYFNRNE